MENAVAETNGNAVSTNVANGIAGEFSREDVQQGRLMVMQSNSTFVKDESARNGAIVNIVDMEELAYKGGKDGKDKKDLEFMITGVVKYWVVKNADTDTFVGKFPAISANELPWNETVDGVNLERTFHYSYIVIIPEEIEQGIEQQYELAFRSTSVKDTKRLNSIIQKLAMKGVSSNERVFKASVVERSNANGKTWWGLDLGLARDASENEAKVCTEYFQNFIESKEKFMSDTSGYEKSETATATEESEY